MSVITSDSVATASEEIDQLRQELKEWERAFAAANGGRKASREDIKKDPTIALKYKDYNRLRPLPANTITQKPLAPSSPSKKRKQRPLPSTPSKRPRSAQQSSPTKISHVIEVDPYDSPATIRNLFRTPTIKRTVFGPTPQKDGKVLGLFDNLSPPSTKKTRVAISSKPASDDAQLLTPRKALQRVGEKEKPLQLSNGQHALPAVTPSKSHTILNGNATPQSTSILQFLTPEFLRRDSRQIRLGPSAVDRQEHAHSRNNLLGHDVGDSPVNVRMPAKAPTKGLSAILAELRKADQERFDDDEEALREIEGGNVKKPAVIVEETQMPLGADGEDLEDETDDEEAAAAQNLGRDGAPLKVWKKKGQKRTTRRVTMRPVRHKSKPKPQAVTQDSGSEDEHSSEDGNDEADKVEAQLPNTLSLVRDPEHDDDSDASNYSPPNLTTQPMNSTKDKRKSKTKRAGQDREKKAENASRKINANATSHANFRRLKLRNKTSKGAGGGGGRYGRGRR